MNVVDISPWSLAAGYALLLFPLAIIFWLRIPMMGQTLIAVLRMTLQLLFVGFYLQFLFDINSPWLNGAWIAIMIVVADISVARGCNLRLARIAGVLFIALLTGTLVPLLFFLGPILMRPGLLDAQYAIPICGMILGNCLRADIIGIKHFYEGLQKGEKAYLNTLAQGARLNEALRPYERDACQAAMTPTVMTIATIGLVALPGMMTGVILGGVDPMTAIKYQIAIMIAILSGTAITVFLAIRLIIRIDFNAYGIMKGVVRKPKA